MLRQNWHISRRTQKALLYVMAFATLLMLATPVIIPTLKLLLTDNSLSSESQIIISAVFNLSGFIFGFLTSFWFFLISSGFGGYYEKLVGLISGSERAGLDRIEPAMIIGTRAEIACSEAHHSIDFIGVGGRKFLTKIFDENTRIGRKIASGHVKVRIMILDPDGKKLNDWTTDESKIKSVRSDIKNTLKFLDEITRESINYKLYDFLPPLRLLIIDNNKVFVSRYDPTSENGWDAPQLCFSQRSNPGPEFPKAFVNLYTFLWSSVNASSSKAGGIEVE